MQSTGRLSLDAVSCADVEERVVQAHAVRNGFEVAGRKTSGMDKVRVEGLGSDEVLDDIARSRRQHTDYPSSHRIVREGLSHPWQRSPESLFPGGARAFRGWIRWYPA